MDEVTELDEPEELEDETDLDELVELDVPELEWVKLSSLPGALT